MPEKALEGSILARNLEIFLNFELHYIFFLGCEQWFDICKWRIRESLLHLFDTCVLWWIHGHFNLSRVIQRGYEGYQFTGLDSWYLQILLGG